MGTEKQQNKKLELKLGEMVRVKLLRDKAYEGSSAYGKYYLYAVEHEGTEKSFFAPEEIHQQIVAHGLKAGSEFTLKKIAERNGKKITGQLVFELVPPTAPEEQIKPGPTNGNDAYREIMEHCLADAIAIVKSAQADGVPFQAEDLRAISSCLFIARTRIN